MNEGDTMKAIQQSIWPVWYGHGMRQPPAATLIWINQVIHFHGDGGGASDDLPLTEQLLTVDASGVRRGGVGYDIWRMLTTVATERVVPRGCSCPRRWPHTHVCEAWPGGVLNNDKKKDMGLAGRKDRWL